MSEATTASTAPGGPQPAEPARAPNASLGLDDNKLLQKVALYAALFSSVTASLVYVMLVAAYRLFYGQLGVHPEDVGIDRQWILGRTAGVVVYLLLFLILPLALFLALLRKLWGKFSGRIDPRGELSGRSRAVLAFARRNHTIMLLVIAAMLVAISVVFGAYFVVFKARFEGGMAVLGYVQPSNSNPISGYESSLDVSAVRARVVWLSNTIPMPKLLTDPWLLYLGQGSKGVVLVACGETLIVPPNQIAVELLPGERGGPPFDEVRPSCRDV
jgi:hypothetical protein